MLVEHVLDRRTDAQRGIERLPGILRDVRHEAAAQAARRPLVASVHPSARNLDGSSDDAHSRARVAQKGQGCGRLPASRLPDEPDDLAGRDRERQLVDDRSAGLELDPEVADGESGLAHRTSPTADRPSVLATASPTRFTAMVSSAIRSAGARITYGFRSSPERFSLMISAQSEAGGCRPSPRKLTEATRMIEYVKRRPTSAAIGATMLGSSSRRTIALVRSPRRDRGLDEAAHRLLQRGCAHDARDERRLDECDPDDQDPGARSCSRDEDEQEDERWKRQQHVDEPHEHGVRESAVVAGDQADDSADEVREQRGQAGVEEHGTAAPEDTAEDVSPEEVGAQGRALGRSRERDPDGLVRSMRREEGPDEREDDHAHEQREPDRTRGCPHEPEAVSHSAVLSFGTRSTTSTSATMLMAM